MPTQKPPRIPLPKGWPSHVKSGVLHIISLAHFSTTHARGWAAKSVSARVRIAAEKDRAEQTGLLAKPNGNNVQTKCAYSRAVFLADIPVSYFIYDTYTKVAGQQSFAIVYFVLGNWNKTPHIARVKRNVP